MLFFFINCHVFVHLCVSVCVCRRKNFICFVISSNVFITLYESIEFLFHEYTLILFVSIFLFHFFSALLLSIFPILFDVRRGNSRIIINEINSGHNDNTHTYQWPAPVPQLLQPPPLTQQRHLI